MFCPSGEISPNLATLVTNQYILPTARTIENKAKRSMERSTSMSKELRTLVVGMFALWMSSNMTVYDPTKLVHSYVGSFLAITYLGT